MDRIDPQDNPDSRATSRRARFAYGMWLRAGFVGVSLVAAGAASLADGSARPPNALAMTVAGVALAAWSWRRVQAALARIGAVAGTPAVATAAAPPRGRAQMLAQQVR